MDLQKLIVERDRMIAEAEKMLKGRAADPAAFRRPIDIQEAQAGRIEERIASLEASRAEFARSIDAELKELKTDLEARRRKIERDRKELDAMAGREHAAAAAAARTTARPAPPRKAAAKPKAAKPKARAKPKAKAKPKAAKPKASGKPVKRAAARKPAGRGTGKGGRAG